MVESKHFEDRYHQITLWNFIKSLNLSYEFHPLANLLPLLDGEDLEQLTDDIKKNGLLEPIILYENKILDGRNRYIACTKAGIAPHFKDYDLDLDPLTFIISENFHRRHLSPAQKGEFGVYLVEIEKERAKKRKLAQLKPFQNKEIDIKEDTIEIIGEKSDGPFEGTSEDNGRSLDKVAKMLKTSKNTIQIAKKVKELNDPDINKKWESAKRMNTTIKAVKVAIQKKENKDKPIITLPEDEFNVIYADPPWFYESGTTPNRIIENQYPTMETRDICNMEVPSSKDAILFLWVTSPKLEDGLEVIKAWGFTYKTNMVWVKDKIGMGYYARGQHELLLIGTKGSPGTPKPENRPSSVIDAPRTKHSKKPSKMYELIEQMYPEGKYLELFARNNRNKWTSWGNEV